MELYEELCTCFIDWRKPLDYVNWTNLIAESSGKWDRLTGKKLISKMHVDQSVKLELDQRRIGSVKIARGITK